MLWSLFLPFEFVTLQRTDHWSEQGMVNLLNESRYDPATRSDRSILDAFYQAEILRRRSEVLSDIIGY